MRDRLQLWWYLNADNVKRWAAAAVAGLVVIVLLRKEADRLLDYLRVLIWPVVVLTAILIFREPLLRVLRGLYVKELNWRGSRVLFGQHPQQQNEGDLLPVPDPSAADELENFRIGANVAGALLQAFQMQIDFLKVLERAPEGLSRQAAEAWFAEQVDRLDLDHEVWNPAALLGWMETRGLIAYTPAGNLTRSELGDRVAALTDTFWYAPKLI